MYLKINRRTWNVLLATALLGAGSTQAADLGISRDLIVRLRQPQNSDVPDLSFLGNNSETSTLGGQVLNGAEGVIRLKYKTVKEALAARTKLLRSGKVMNAAPDFLYSPAIQYSLDDVAPAANAGNTFVSVPFASLGDYPEVQLPPSSVTPGEDPLASKDWSIESIHLPAAEKSDTLSKMITAVIDTGVDYNHEDLVGAMWRKEGNDREVGMDFIHNAPKPYDVAHFDVEGCQKDPKCLTGQTMGQYFVNPGHGTHCAGHVAAVADNSIGIRGVGAGSRIMGLKFFYDFGEENAGRGDDAAAIQSIDYAIKNGAKVISASWGGRGSRPMADFSELKNAIVRAQKAGVLFVVAAGNDAIDQDNDDAPSFPAAYDLDNMIVVAASDKDDTLAKFSNFGATSVHLAAPGVKILSTTVGSQYADVIGKLTMNDGKVKEIKWSGTSMATPIVAGAAALVWSKFPNENYHQIRDRLLKSVRKVPALDGKVSTGGVLDVAAALSAGASSSDSGSSTEGSDQ